MGIGGSVLSILTQFLSNRSQQVIVDGCRSKLVNIVSGVPQGSFLGVWSVEVRRRAGVEGEFASGAFQRALRWFGHV